MSNTDPQSDSPEDLARELDSELEEEATIVIQQPLYVEHQKGQGYSVRPRKDDEVVDEAAVTDTFDAGAVTEAYDMGSMTEQIPIDQFPTAAFSDDPDYGGDMSPVTEALPSVADEDVVVLIDDTEALPSHMTPQQGFMADDAPNLSSADPMPFSSAEDTPLLMSAPGTEAEITEMVTSEHLPELEDVEDIASLIEERTDGSLTAPSEASLEFQLPVEDILEEKSPVTSVLWLVAAVLVVAAVVVFWRQSPDTLEGDGSGQIAQANTVMTNGSGETPDVNTVGPTSTGTESQFHGWVRGALADSLGQFVEDTAENR